MGWNHSLICLTCDSMEEVDLETDSEELKNWMIKHWGHKAKIEWYEGGELNSQNLGVEK